jgi:hypothetical protein
MEDLVKALFLLLDGGILNVKEVKTIFIESLEFLRK